MTRRSESGTYALALLNIPSLQFEQASYEGVILWPCANTAEEGKRTL